MEFRKKTRREFRRQFWTHEMDAAPYDDQFRGRSEVAHRDPIVGPIRKAQNASRRRGDQADSRWRFTDVIELVEKIAVSGEGGIGAQRDRDSLQRLGRKG